MNKIGNIFRTQYKILISLLLFAFAAGNVWGQGQAPVTFASYETTYIFTCNKIVPIDLYKAANFFVSPEYGYWGDEYGTPYNGKPSSALPPYADPWKSERELTNGNIFNAVAADSGYYKFYFYVTASEGYCGIKTGERFELKIHLVIGCRVRLDGSLEPEYWFCHGSSYEQRMHYNFDPTTLESLLFLNLPPSEQVLWTITPPSINPAIYVWDAIEVYSDSLYKNKIGDNKYTINVSPENSNVDYDSTYYVLIHRHDGQEIIHTVRVRIFKKPELVIYTNPANLQDKFKEYSLDDEITIGDESEGTAFESYKYYLNRKYINEHFYGGDTTRKEITLSAATFSGVEDFLEIIAVDTNKCVAKWSSEAIINIPFPTVFTPDGDGVNDIFFGGEKYRNREFHLEIFNRWGNRIYYGESGWDGSYRGKEAPPATYEYVIQIKMSDGTTKEVRGTVTLIRKGIK